MSEKHSCQHFHESWTSKCGLTIYEKQAAGEEWVAGMVDDLKPVTLFTTYRLETSFGYHVDPLSPIQIADHLYPDLLVLGANRAYLIEVRNIFYYYLRNHPSRFYWQDSKWVTGYTEKSGRKNRGIAGKNWEGPIFPIRNTSKMVWNRAVKKSVRQADTIDVGNRKIIPVYVSTVESFNPKATKLFNNWLAEKHGHAVWTEHAILPLEKMTDDDMPCMEKLTERLRAGLERILRE
jgi:hypothetical protein